MLYSCYIQSASCFHPIWDPVIKSLVWLDCIDRLWVISVYDALWSLCEYSQHQLNCDVRIRNAGLKIVALQLLIT